MTAAVQIKGREARGGLDANTRAADSPGSRSVRTL
jgi:hypothetical protein